MPIYSKLFYPLNNALIDGTKGSVSWSRENGVMNSGPEHINTLVEKGDFLMDSQLSSTLVNQNVQKLWWKRTLSKRFRKWRILKKAPCLTLTGVNGGVWKRWRKKRHALWPPPTTICGRLDAKTHQNVRACEWEQNSVDRWKKLNRKRHCGPK